MLRLTAALDRMPPARRTWLEALPRVAADVWIVGASLALALLARLMTVLAAPPTTDPARVIAAFLACFWQLGPLLASTLVATFALTGVYSRKRFYTAPYKALSLAQSISLSYAVSLLAAYLFSYRELFQAPRSAFLISYGLTLAGCLGARLLKAYWIEVSRAEAARPARAHGAQRVLVVGGAGYIGSVLVRDLLADGCQVRALDSLLYGDESIRALYGRPGFELVRGDFRHVGTVVQAAKGMDAVIHLGGIVGDPACEVDEDETLETNLAATRLLAEVCRASGVSRLLFASTCSVYGAADHVVDERSRLSPISLYAATKIDSERVLLAARSRDFHPVILRLATAFGWSFRPRFDLVVNLLAARAAVEKRILIYNGEQWRPFIHVADISRVFRMALNARPDLVSGETFNAGANTMNFTLREVAQQVAAEAPGIEVDYRQNADARNYRVSFDKIHSRLGFTCQTTLAAGIREIHEALQRGAVADYHDPRYSNVEQMAGRSEKKSAASVEVELTALQFARNSLWWRAMAAGAAGDELLRDGPSSLVALARAVEQQGAVADPETQ